VGRKLEAGETAAVTTLEDAPSAAADNVVDLTELLAKSLAKRKPVGSAADSTQHAGRREIVRSQDLGPTAGMTAHVPKRHGTLNGAAKGVPGLWG